MVIRVSLKGPFVINATRLANLWRLSVLTYSRPNSEKDPSEDNNAIVTCRTGVHVHVHVSKGKYYMLYVVLIANFNVVVYLLHSCGVSIQGFRKYFSDYI